MRTPYAGRHIPRIGHGQGVAARKTPIPHSCGMSSLSQHSMPSLTARAAMMRAAAWSAHHDPSRVLRPTLRSAATELKAQKPVSAESATRGAVLQSLPGAALR
jgi:hypothetical protein